MPSARLPHPAAAVWAAGVVVLGVGVLSGCDSSATPGGSGSVNASASSTASASPSPSGSASPSTSPSVEIPAAAREKTDKGAEAFVRFFFDQVNEAWTTPGVELIPPHSDDGCKSCHSLQSTAKKLASQGQRYAESPVSVRAARSVPGAPHGQQLVEVDLVQNQVDVVDAGGKVISTDKKANFTRTVALVWRDGRWLVYDMA